MASARLAAAVGLVEAVAAAHIPHLSACLRLVLSYLLLIMLVLERMPKLECKIVILF